MKTLILVAVLMGFGVVGCSSDSGSSGSSGGNNGVVANESEPLFNKSFFTFANKSGTQVIGEYFKITSASNITGMIALIDKSTGQMFYRKLIGTFTRSGSTYSVNFTEATCLTDIKKMTYEVSGNPDDSIFIRVNGNATALKYYNDEVYMIPGIDSTTVTSTTEDVNCNLVAAPINRGSNASATKVSSGRSPANSHKSIWSKLQ